MPRLDKTESFLLRAPLVPATTRAELKRRIKRTRAAQRGDEPRLRRFVEVELKRLVNKKAMRGDV